MDTFSLLWQRISSTLPLVDGAIRKAVLDRSFWYGRLIIFGATFVTAGGDRVGRSTRKAGRTLIAVIAGLGVPVIKLYLSHWSPCCGQHLLMVMFETLAVVIIADAFKNGRNAKRKRRLAIALLMLLCGGYTKQLVYATCIAVALWLMLQKPSDCPSL